MNQSLTDAAVRSAIEATHGCILFAAQTLGVTRQEFLDYAADRPWVAALVDDYRDRLLDDARMQLHTAAAEQLPWAIGESLQTLGRDRGYGAPEYAGPFVIYPAPPPEPEPNFNLLSEPERARLQELLTIINRETITLEETRTAEPETGPAPFSPPEVARSDSTGLEQKRGLAPFSPPELACSDSTGLGPERVLAPFSPPEMACPDSTGSTGEKGACPLSGEPTEATRPSATPTDSPRLVLKRQSSAAANGQPGDIRDLDEDEVRAVLRKYMGHLGCAADALKLTRSQLRDYIGGAPALQRMLDGFIEDLIDLAEWGLRVAVNNRKRWAVCFALRTRGRKMGHGKHPPYQPLWPEPKPPYDLKLLSREEVGELQGLLGKAEGLEEASK